MYRSRLIRGKFGAVQGFFYSGERMKFQEVVMGVGILVVIVVTALSYVPVFGITFGSRLNAREKACYANMRVLLGALEMYNMDNSVFLEEMNPKVMMKLHTDGYLKVPIHGCPGDQTPRFNHPFLQERLRILSANLGASHLAYRQIPGGFYGGTDLASAGVIFCTMHGTIE